MQHLEIASGSLDEVNEIACGPLTLDLRGFSVTVNGRDVDLTLSEFAILAELARHPHSVMTRETLVEVLQAREATPAAPPSLRSIDVHVARIRQKLRGAGCQCITTMRRVGYRFAPPVIQVGAEPRESSR
jgi:DNA-binding response OmpR family regulator